MTSGAHVSDDFFKVWAATKLNLGSKLVIAPHSSLYGSCRWLSYENHELKIADRYFSWGWSKDNINKITVNSHGRLINSKDKLRHNSEGGLLQVLNSLPRYSHYLYSSPISSQSLSYEEDQLIFAQALSKEIRAKLTVRPYIVDYGWDQKERWNDNFPDVDLDYNPSFYKTMRNNKLLVGTTNSTVLFEALTANIPIVAFWNPVFWELRESAKPYYDLLSQVHILNNSPEEAADFINHNWDDIEQWWYSTDVQEARIEFCNKFANLEEDWVNQWKVNLENSA